MLFTQSTTYLIRRGCKFTMTNVYFKKENDIILNGTLCREVENESMLCAPLAITKTLRRRGAGRGPPSHCPVCLSLLWSALTPTGVPPSGLFIVESVFSCFIMKNKFAKVY